MTSRSSGPMNSTTKARISECSVQAAWGMSAGQTAASPAAIRVRSSPTPTQPPPSTTMNRVMFGFACASVRALREGELGHVATPVRVEHLAAQPDRSDGAARTPVPDAEPADLDRHPRVLAAPAPLALLRSPAALADGRLGIGVLLLAEVALAGQLLL